MSAVSDLALLRAKSAAQAFAESIAAASWLDTGETFAEGRRLKLLAEAQRYLADVNQHMAVWGAEVGQAATAPNVVPLRPEPASPTPEPPPAAA